MSLRDRLNLNDDSENKQKDDQAQQIDNLPEEIVHEAPAGVDFSSLKEQLNVLLVEKVNSTPVWINYSDSQQKALLKQFVEGQLSNSLKEVSLDKNEKEKLVKEIIEEAQGFGPLDPLLKDNDVSYILVNGAKDVYVEKGGKLSKTNVVFKDDLHLKNFIERIVANTGKRIDEKSPMAEVKLANGFHINAVLPPLSLEGPVLSIKKAPKNIQNLNGLVKQGFLSKEMSDILSLAVKAKLNIIISGSSGAGKTTLLSALIAEIPKNERIITVEDSAELIIQRSNAVRFEARGASMDMPEITTKDLTANALRMRPDRIIIGQCRSTEAFDMIQAINGGTEGFLTTVFANSPKDAVSRLESMSLCPEAQKEQPIRAQIVSAINLIVNIARLPDGARKITSICEVSGFDGKELVLDEIFSFKQDGIENFKVIGEHVSTGIKPKFTAKMKEANFSVPVEYFDKERKHVYSLENLVKSSAKPEFDLKKRLFGKH